MEFRCETTVNLDEVGALNEPSLVEHVWIRTPRTPVMLASTWKGVRQKASVLIGIKKDTDQKGKERTDTDHKTDPELTG